jgi:hypothetical protein
MTRKRWSELSGRQQAALAAATLWDVRRRPRAEIRGTKKLWVAAAFVNFVGPLAYFTPGRRRG